MRRSIRRPRLTALVSLAMTAAILVSCGAEDRGNSPSPTGSAPAITSSAALPSTPAGDQLAWVLQHAQTASDDELRQHFSAEFLDAVPPAQLRETLGQFGELTVVGVDAVDDHRLDATVATEGGVEYKLSLAVDPASQQITGFALQPAEVPSTPTNWDEVDQRLSALAPNISFVAAEVGPDDSLMPIRSRAAEVEGPIGSVFKLYVLGAVTEAVRAGTLAWDTELTIRPELKSLPSGELQDRPDNSTVTAAEAAEKMIAISDNTAADLLIDRVGRPAVEAMLTTMGMAPVSQRRTLPFISTRELFTLKWGVDPATREAYIDAATDERRQLLTELPATLPEVSAIDPKVPVAVDSLEWFASAQDLARAHIWLDRQRSDPALAPLTTILGANPGVHLDQATWPNTSFKGGSEPGVVTLSWLVHRQDGRRFVVALGAADPTRPVDELEEVSIATGVFELLAKN